MRLAATKASTAHCPSATRSHSSCSAARSSCRDCSWALSPSMTVLFVVAITCRRGSEPVGVGEEKGDRALLTTRRWSGPRSRGWKGSRSPHCAREAVASAAPGGMRCPHCPGHRPRQRQMRSWRRQRQRPRRPPPWHGRESRHRRADASLPRRVALWPRLVRPRRGVEVGPPRPGLRLARSPPRSPAGARFIAPVLWATAEGLPWCTPRRDLARKKGGGERTKKARVGVESLEGRVQRACRDRTSRGNV